MNKTEEIFTKKQFKAEVKSANVTDSGLALKLIVPFTEMMPIIPTLAESIGQVIDFEPLVRETPPFHGQTDDFGATTA